MHKYDPPHTHTHTFLPWFLSLLATAVNKNVFLVNLCGYKEEKLHTNTATHWHTPLKTSPRKRRRLSASKHMYVACALHTQTNTQQLQVIWGGGFAEWYHLEKPLWEEKSSESGALTGQVDSCEEPREWSCSVTHYPLSVSHCGHYWQAMDLELELNLTGASVITRLDTHRTETHTRC